MLVGNRERAGGAGPEVRLEDVELVDRYAPRGRVAVLGRFAGDAGEGLLLLGRPRDQERTRPLDRDAEPRAVLQEQRMAAPHEPSLERAGLGVEARVQDRRVRLAGAGADVVAGFEEDAGDLVLREVARDRRTDHAGADDGDIVRQSATRSIVASTTLRQARRRALGFVRGGCAARR